MKLTPVAPPVESELSFEDWARAKFEEVNANVNPCDESGSLDPRRLNEVLTQFAGHFAWAITIQEVEGNKLHILSHQYDKWYKERYNEAFRLIQQETGGGRPPGQTTIEARMVDLCGQDMEDRRIALENKKSRVALLKDFVKVLDRQASILQTLSSNMRSELFFSSGLTIKDNTSTRMMTDTQKNDVAKTALRQAMHTQS